MTNLPLLKRAIVCIALLLGIANGTSPSHASEGNSPRSPATQATILGRVLNLATGAFLEGATVTFHSSGRSTLTSRDGTFIFPPHPSGEYQLTASYTGLDSATSAVSLAPGQSLQRDISLTSQAYAMAAFVVPGEREGNALAITQQRNAPNVKNVLSADACGNVADQNIGNLLIRIPGVTEEIVEGEVASVMSRIHSRVRQKRDSARGAI